MKSRPKPITGKDLKELQKDMGLSVTDASWLLSMAPNKWARVVNQNADDPVPDEACEILVQLLKRRPDLSPLPTMPKISDVFLRMWEIQLRASAKNKDLAPLTKAEFGLLLGRDRVAGWNWIERGDKPNPVVQHLAYVIDRWLDECKQPEQAELLLRALRNIVQEVAEGRGLKGDIFAVGKWPKAKKEKKPAKK